MLLVAFGCTPAGDTEDERSNRRRILLADGILVKGNNIFFTVAFAESYRKTVLWAYSIFIFYVFSDFLVAEQSAIFYYKLKESVKNEKTNF